MNIAVSHPGRIGDALYYLPTIRHIAKIHDTKIDFWTSDYCKPLVSLFKAQSCINEVYIAKNYIIQHHGCGTQPWELTPEKEYDRIYYGGLRSYPQGRLVDYYPALHGFTFCDTSIQYDFTTTEVARGIVVCPGRNPLLKALFGGIISELSNNNIIVYQVGPKDEIINFNSKNVINYDIDMLNTLSVLDKADVFIGTLSANLVLANGFPCQKIVICEKERHNPTHDILSENHTYLDFPVLLKEVIKCVKL